MRPIWVILFFICFITVRAIPGGPLDQLIEFDFSQGFSCKMSLSQSVHAVKFQMPQCNGQACFRDLQWVRYLSEENEQRKSKCAINANHYVCDWEDFGQIRIQLNQPVFFATMNGRNWYELPAYFRKNLWEKEKTANCYLYSEGKKRDL